MERRIFETRDDSRPLERTEKSVPFHPRCSFLHLVKALRDGQMVTQNTLQFTMDQLLVFVF